MIKDQIADLYNTVNALNDNKLSLVTYQNNTITYQQIGKTVMLSKFHLFYKPDPKFKYGVLTQQQLMKIKETLLRLIQDKRIDEQTALITPDVLGFKVYSLLEEFVGPQIIDECNLVGVRNKFIVRILLRFTNSESRLLLKLLKKTK